MSDRNVTVAKGEDRISVSNTSDENIAALCAIHGRENVFVNGVPESENMPEDTVPEEDDEA